MRSRGVTAKKLKLAVLWTVESEMMKRTSQTLEGSNIKLSYETNGGKKAAESRMFRSHFTEPTVTSGGHNLGLRKERKNHSKEQGKRNNLSSTDN